MEELIGKIVEDWFLTEPALFAAYCTHSLQENRKMCVPMRSGKMRIEYNPKILGRWDAKKIEERLKFEVIRVLLGHPYQRQPYKATKAALGMASDVTLTTLYNRPDSIELPPDLEFEKGKCFEEYYALVAAYLDREMMSPPYEVEGMIDDGGGGASEDGEKENDCNDSGDGNSSGGASGNPHDDSDGGTEEESEEGDARPQRNDSGDELNNQEDDDDEDDGEGDEDEQEEGDGADETELERMARQDADSAGLWEEDQLAHEQVKEVIARAQRSRQWGTLGGKLIDEIIASTVVHIDYRRILSGFRASVLSSQRHLTRMVPSRRYGFEFMGSKRDFCTRLLVAIDVSGSVSNPQVSQALSIINRFFKYGIEQIDVIQFDVDVKGEPISLRKAAKRFHVEGRGGTDFQQAIDYFCSSHYDGLLMITDGYAPQPTLPQNFHGNILWMIYNDMAWRGCGVDNALEWINQLPRNRYTVLPPVAQ